MIIRVLFIVTTLLYILSTVYAISFTITAGAASQYWFQLDLTLPASAVKVRCADNINNLEKATWGEVDKVWVKSGYSCPVGSEIDVSVKLLSNNNTYQASMIHNISQSVTVDLENYVPPEDPIDVAPVDNFFNGTMNDFFLWPDPNTGDAVVVFKDGTMKKIQIIWAGYAAWKELDQVLDRIKTLLERGIVPFIHLYHFGDDGLRGDHHLAVEFDTAVAQAIGNYTLAYINIETEWDDRTYMQFLESPEGIQMFKDRFAAFRRYTNKAVLSSSPGLWLTTPEYTWFAELDDRVDFRAHSLQFVNSYNKTCSERSSSYNVDGNATYWNFGIMSEQDALAHTIKRMKLDNNKMDAAWGPKDNNWITADVGLSSCGWGCHIQAQILNQWVTNLDCLYASGYRGMALRNGAPAAENRAMGYLNEGGMIWNGGEFNCPETIAVAQTGLQKVIEMMQNGGGICAEPLIYYSLEVTTDDPLSYNTPIIGVNQILNGFQITCSGVKYTLQKTPWNEQYWWTTISGGGCTAGTTVGFKAIFLDNTYVTGTILYSPNQLASINLEVDEPLPLPSDEMPPPDPEESNNNNTPPPGPPPPPVEGSVPEGILRVTVTSDAGPGWFNFKLSNNLVTEFEVKCAGAWNTISQAEWNTLVWYKGPERSCPYDSSIKVTFTLTSGLYLSGELSYTKGDYLDFNMTTDTHTELPAESVPSLTIDLRNTNPYWFSIVLNKDATSFTLTCDSVVHELSKASYDVFLWTKSPSAPCPSGSSAQVSIQLPDGTTVDRTITFSPGTVITLNSMKVQDELLFASANRNIASLWIVCVMMVLSLVLFQ
jgi:hypothetical protein